MWEVRGMTGWSAMAGTHDFLVPGEESARGLADALAEHGFSLVTGQPAGEGNWWAVTAFDEGPYPVETFGHRMINAVGRRAAVVAAEYGGYPGGATRCDVDALTEGYADAPIRVTNPGVRPPVPAVAVLEAPPSVALPLTPDEVQAGPIELAGLDEVPWAELEHAHGPADDVPGLLRELAAAGDDWDEILDVLFGDDLLHQGDCDSATAPALPFLTQMITSGALPAQRRLDLYVWLLIAAGRWADNLIGLAWYAAATHRPPTPAAWTEEVRTTVGEQLPVLLARWDTEPPAGKFVLACLAGLYPQHGSALAVGTGSMAGDFAGTRQGAYLKLAEALAHGREEALTLATDIVAWEPRHDPGWLEAPGVPAVVRAGHVLAEGAQYAVGGSS
jgi:hypothetical protein